MKCTPKTMVKIGAIIFLVLAVGYVAFPPFGSVILALAPFALFALCPLAMMLGMNGMLNGDKRRVANKNALQILMDRYAKGEISKEEFESKRRDVSSC